MLGPLKTGNTDLVWYWQRRQRLEFRGRNLGNRPLVAASDERVLQGPTGAELVGHISRYRNKDTRRLGLSVGFLCGPSKQWLFARLRTLQVSYIFANL